MPPQNQANTSAQTPAPPPPLDFSSIPGWSRLDEGDLQARTLQQAKSELPQPDISRPWEDEPTLNLPPTTKLGKAYVGLKNWLGEHEQHVSEKYLAPFREGLNRMGDDLQQAAASGHTKSGGALTPTTRLLVGGVGTLLHQVPVGSNVSETVQALATPPELGPEGKALSKELKATKSAAVTETGWLTKDGRFEPLRTGEGHYDAANRLGLDVKTREGAQPTYDALDAGHIRVYRHQKANGSHFEAESINEQSKNTISKALKDSSFPQGHAVQLEFHKPKYTLKEFESPEQAREWLENLGSRTESAPDFSKIPGHQEITPPPKPSIAKELPPQPRLPNTGTHAAIKTDDGSIYFDDAPEKQRSHIMLAKDLGIPPERVVSGGWLTDGHYEGSARSDAGKWGEQARAQARVADKRAASSQTPSTETLYHGSPDVSKIGSSLRPGKKGGYFGDGIYLSRDPKVAQRFTKLEAMNPTLEPNADGSFTDINTGKRIPAGKPGVLNVSLKGARLKSITIEEMDAQVEKFRQPNGVINLDAARNAIANKYAKQGYDGFDVPASKNFNEPQVLIFPGSAEKLSIAEKTAAKELPTPTTRTPEAKARERQSNLKHMGIGLTEMNPEDAKNWVGYTGKEKTLKVYRGVDDPSHSIESGDFVTTSKESAQNYGKHVQEMEVSPEELRYVRGHKDGDPKLLDIGGTTELIYAPKTRNEPKADQFHYHSTLAKNIPSITKNGLRPNKSGETNWGGMLGQDSHGNLFFSDTPDKAKYYGNIVFRNTLQNEGQSSIALTLRIKNAKGLTTSPDWERGEFSTKKPVPPENIEVWWQNKWQPLNKVSKYLNEETSIRAHEDGGYVDWEGEEHGRTAQEAADRTNEYTLPKEAPAPKATQPGPQALAQKLGGRVVGSAATGKTTPDAYGINRGAKDWDIRIEGKTSTKDIRSQMETLGFEFQGGSVVSPAEVEQFEKRFGKKFAPGWNNVEHFTNKSGQKVDVWHSEGLFGVREINKKAGKALGSKKKE